MKCGRWVARTEDEVAFCTRWKFHWGMHRGVIHLKSTVVEERPGFASMQTDGMSVAPRSRVDVMIRVPPGAPGALGISDIEMHELQ